MKNIKYIFYTLGLISIVMSVHLNHYYNAIFMVLFLAISETGDYYGRKLLGLVYKLKALEMCDYMRTKSIMHIIYDEDDDVYVITSDIISGLVVTHNDREECIKLALGNGLILIEAKGILDDRK